MNELAITLIIDGALLLFLCSWGFATERKRDRMYTTTKAFEKWNKENNNGS